MPKSDKIRLKLDTFGKKFINRYPGFPRRKRIEHAGWGHKDDIAQKVTHSLGLLIKGDNNPSQKLKTDCASSAKLKKTSWKDEDSHGNGLFGNW